MHTKGVGVARILAHPDFGNRAVAIIARNAQNLEGVAQSIKASVPGSVVHPFPCDTDPGRLSKTFKDIGAHPDFKGLKLDLAVW